jgi:hypothetical protein
MNKEIRNKTGREWWLIVPFLLMDLIIGSGCKKFVEVAPPSNYITENTVFTNDATAIAVLTDMYNNMNSSPIQGGTSAGSIALFAGLSADELVSATTSSNYVGYYANTLSQTGNLISGGEHWVPLYKFVFKCNAAIEGLNKSESLTASIKQQLLGEAKFLRAFFYFYLVNEFGDVPLALSTDPKVNTLLARSSSADVYRQIIADLQDAEEKLSTDYLDVTLQNKTLERVRPTKWAAAALLARVYLYTGDYANAEAEANKVISNTSLFDPPSAVSLNNVFLKNSREAIWQIQPTSANFNTPEARTLIIPAAGPSTGGSTTNPVYLNKQLVASFETGDQRVVYGNWVDTTIYMISKNPVKWDTVPYPNKYKLNALDPNITAATGTTKMKEYFMVLRLGEQYLIRGEARTQLGDIQGAQDDLNAIRNRAGLPNTTANDKSSLLTAILNERRHELFSEWGHRWFDLKRTDNIDAVMTVETPKKSNGTSQWQSYKALYPLPLETINGAPNVTQNDGYQ